MTPKTRSEAKNRSATMPRKKAGEASTARPLTEGPALRITCPACKSEVSGDGATLHARSKYLEELRAANSKRQLAEFVIEKAFEPVMRAKRDGKSDAEGRTLQHVQQATRAEIERYRGYKSAAAVATSS